MAGAVAALLVPPAEAKFRMTLTVQPAQPVARSLARLTIRTDVPLARQHGIRMFAVGPWRAALGQATFEPRLVRTAPRTLTATVRFRYAGRWHLSIPASANSSPLDVLVRVRPRG